MKTEYNRIRVFKAFIMCLSLIWVWSNVLRAEELVPGIFLGQAPGVPISVNPSGKFFIPMFVFMGDRAGQPAEFFVARKWRVGGPEGVQWEYLVDENGAWVWRPFSEPSEIRPIIQIQGGLPRFVNVSWQDTIFLKPYPPEDPPRSRWEYILYVCFDFDLNQTLDYAFSSAEGPYCANVTVSYSPESNEGAIEDCQGLNVNEIQVEFFRGVSPAYTYQLLDGCGNPLSECTIETRPSMLAGANFEENTLIINFKEDLSAGNYTGDLTFSCGGASYTLPIKARVLSLSSLSFCRGELVLRDENTGIEYPQGQTIFLSARKTLGVYCKRYIFGRESASTIDDFAFTPESRCFYGENHGGRLVLTPRGDGDCSSTLVISTRDKRATFTVSLGGETDSGKTDSTPTCSLAISPTSLNFSGSGFQRLSIKDSCGNDLAYTVTDVSGSWIIFPYEGQHGTGSLLVKVSASGLSEGEYSGSIELDVSGYGRVEISVILEVTSASLILSVRPSEIAETLEPGRRSSVEVTVTCSGNPPSRLEVRKVSGGDWFSVRSIPNGLVEVTLNSSELEEGRSYSGSFRVETECGEATVPVTLRVSGCEATNATLSPDALTVLTTEGTNPQPRTVSVIDNCGRALNFSVLRIEYTGNATGWLSTNNNTPGELKLTFDAEHLRIGIYSAIVTIKPENLNELSLRVILKVEEVNPITLVRGQIYFTHFAPGEAKLFVFRSASKEIYPNLAVGINTPSMYGDSQLIGLLARAGENCEFPPFNLSVLLSVLKDLRERWEAGQQDYLGRTEEGYYYAISDALVKNIWAREDAPSGTCWYLWVYNASPDRSFSNVRISFTGPRD